MAATNRLPRGKFPPAAARGVPTLTFEGGLPGLILWDFLYGGSLCIFFCSILAGPQQYENFAERIITRFQAICRTFHLLVGV